MPWFTYKRLTSTCENQQIGIVELTTALNRLSSASWGCLVAQWQVTFDSSGLIEGAAIVLGAYYCCKRKRCELVNLNRSFFDDALLMAFCICAGLLRSQL
jgi:hypothetical protein